MTLILASEVLRIEHIGVWTLVPFLIVLVAGLASTVAWVLRPKGRR